MRPRFGKRYQGILIIEFAIILGLLIFMFLAAGDFGRIFYAQIALENAVRSGASFGTRVGGAYLNDSGILAAASADDGSLSGVSITIPARTCVCTGGSPVACDGSCGGTDPTPKIFLTVQSDYLFEAITDFPGLPTSVPLRAKAVMRAQ
jgi:Flp pilus assembly protein TadG